MFVSGESKHDAQSSGQEDGLAACTLRTEHSCLEHDIAAMQDIFLVT